MKTNLNRTITNRKEAIAYLTDLFNNNEAYHCDDDAHELIWDLPKEQQPTKEQCDQMNVLMDKVHEYHEDPCKVVLDLGYSPDDIAEMERDELEYIKDKFWPNKALQNTISVHLDTMNSLYTEGNYYTKTNETVRYFIDKRIETCDPRTFIDLSPKEKMEELIKLLTKFKKP